jgi:hypothetical protein
MREHEDEFQLPRELQEELRGLYGSARGMNERDAEILSAARQAGEAALTRRRYWRRMGAVGMAAAVALVAGLLWRQIPGGGVATEKPYARTGDIRDAYYVARQLKAAHTSGTPTPQALEGQWDANRDRVVDEKDVRVLALAAVKLTRVTP